MSHFSKKIEDAIDDYRKASSQLASIQTQKQDLQDRLAKLATQEAAAQAKHDQAAQDLEDEIKKL